MPHFSELSPEAQSAIVGAVVGEPVPTLSESVKAEIQAWAETDDAQSSKAKAASELARDAEVKLTRITL